MKPLPTVRNLKKHHNDVKAVDGVSFELLPDQTLALVGESGCGKSTLARALMGLETPNSGEILLDSRPLSSIPPGERCRIAQMVFQDPLSSLNPRKPAWRLIAEPLLVNTKKSRQECRIQALGLMEKVGLDRSLAQRHPHQLSGGQRQRIGVARALALNPKMLVCDEPLSSLDISVQAQVLNLLLELQKNLRLGILFISHDLNVVRHIADHILVMRFGKIVEEGSRQEVLDNPRHPYTQTLVSSIPDLEI